MNNEKLEKIIKQSVIKAPHIEYDSRKILQKCKIEKEKRKIKLINNVLGLCCILIICFIGVFLTIIVMNNNNNMPINNQANVDMGKDSHLSRVGYTQEQYDKQKQNDPEWEPLFDKLIVWGPELASGTIKFDVIYKSNLLNKSDKSSLLEYKTSIEKVYSNHNVSFQIAFGVKDNKDYIYLIDYLGYDNKLKKDVNNIFFFESNLSYSFESIINEFELQINKELSNVFLNSCYYDDQNLLTSGIIIGFIEVDDFYQEYYILKLDGEVYIINK